jgi:hypothetical protein
MFMQRVYLTVMAALMSLLTMAQEKSADVDINVNKGGGGGIATWMWIVGGAVFILLLVALTSRRTSKE